ncbi:MAG: hypothetical protein AAGJ87_03665 [Pseudomonadota bacterium]
MGKKHNALFAAIFVAALSPSTLSARDGAVVLVNRENAVSVDEQEARRLLRRLYLKERTSWPSGERVVFFARSPDNIAEQLFRETVLDMRTGALDDYWLRLKQTRGETPPRAVGSTRILLRQIDAKANAVGVVSLSEYEALSQKYNNIRVLMTLDGENDD